MFKLWLGSSDPFERLQRGTERQYSLALSTWALVLPALVPAYISTARGSSSWHRSFTTDFLLTYLNPGIHLCSIALRTQVTSLVKLGKSIYWECSWTFISWSVAFLFLLCTIPSNSCSSVLINNCLNDMWNRFSLTSTKLRWLHGTQCEAAEEDQRKFSFVTCFVTLVDFLSTDLGGFIPNPRKQHPQHPREKVTEAKEAWQLSGFLEDNLPEVE